MLTFNDYCRKTFGKKLYKLSLDAGFTCPTRDGTLDTRGCVFCDGGSGDFCGQGETLGEQIEDAKRRVAKKSANAGFIAYFQRFTGTYAPIERLRALYGEAVEREDVDVLDVATRPDCLGEDVLDLLSELNEKKPVWVELGLQTTKEESVDYIRRGYPNEVFDEAVRALKARGIKVIVHLILCLPGESIEDMQASLDHAIEAGADGVKLQLLHVPEGTDLAEDYKAGRFALPSLEEYLDLLEALLPRIPETVAVHRLTGDGSKARLLAPLWTGDKKRVMNAINRRFPATQKIRN